MASDIYWVCVFKIEPSRFKEFASLVRPLIEDTRREPGNLAYEYCVTKDHTEIHIIERYKDGDSVVWHVQNTFSRYAEAWGKLAALKSFVVYGDPGSAKATLDGFSASYVDRFDGYTK